MIKRETIFDIFGVKVDFGWGNLSKIGEYATGLKANKALIVTDDGVEKLGFARKTGDFLKKAGIEYRIFKDISGNPTDREVLNGALFYKEEKCDLVIGIGGGSPMDAAKGICVMAVHDEPIDRYYGAGVENIVNSLPPMVLVPTTAGTGSEASRSGIITNTRKQRKEALRSGMPTLALVDPSLTVGMPPFLTAATGIDALSHNIEALETKIFHPIAEAIAFEGIRLVAQSLLKAVENGTSQKAREDLSLAAIMGALAFQKGLCISHSLSHQVSAIHGIHHGATIAVTLPHTMEFNMQAVPDKMCRIAVAFGSHKPTPKSAVEEVTRLIERINLPRTLSELGVKKESLDKMANMAMNDWCVKFNPRDVTETDMKSLYEKAF